MSRLKTVVIGLGVTIAVAGALSLGFCAEIKEGLVDATLKPSRPFDPAAAPPAPDYADDANWAALPGRRTPASDTPPGLEIERFERPAAVFFVHPTTYGYPGGKEDWNQTIGRDSAATTQADFILDAGILRNMASVFNGAGDIYAPRYRQAALYAFVKPTDEAWAAQELAYSDVLRAFDSFLGRIADETPILLAGHSQGSRHLLQLLEDRREALDGRLVAAYLPGWTIPTGLVKDRLDAYGVCEHPEQTNCLISWASFGPKGEMSAMRDPTPVRWGADVRTGEGTTPVCVNPLSWRTDNAAVPSSNNPGSWVHPVTAAANGEPEMDVAEGVTGARCSMSKIEGEDVIEQAGFLIVEPDATKIDLSSKLPGFNYHVYDYPFFHVSVRRNIADRLAAWYSDATTSP